MTTGYTWRDQVFPEFGLVISVFPDSGEQPLVW